MSTAPVPDLASTLAGIAREINAPGSLEATLSAIVESAVRSLPGIDAVSITIAHRDGRMETKAGTDQLVWDLDSVQYELHEGPCVYAIEERPVVKVEHAEDETRWPRYMPVALQRGVRSHLALQLYVDEETLGGLNMYSTSSDTIDPAVEHTAELFATHAALALGKTRRESQLLEAISTRQVIGQATGIVMERYQVDEHRAFDHLARVSSESNTKLREVARHVVDDANRRNWTNRGERPLP